jgi:hypothetical protein
VGIGDTAKNFERPQVVMFDAVARGIHAAQVPLGNYIVGPFPDHIDAGSSSGIVAPDASELCTCEWGLAR